MEAIQKNGVLAGGSAGFHKTLFFSSANERRRPANSVYLGAKKIKKEEKIGEREKNWDCWKMMIRMVVVCIKLSAATLSIENILTFHNILS